MSHVGWRSTTPLGHSHRLCPGLCARWRYADLAYKRPRPTRCAPAGPL